jgi:hypothetical protein
MLRNLVLAGLTALSLTALAFPAHAGGRGATSSRSKSETAPQAQTGGTATDGERSSASSIAPARKKVVKVKVRPRASAQRVARRVQAAVVNHSLLRPGWTIADLNPMPALLDLDDTATNLRRATAEIARLMTR